MNWTEEGLTFKKFLKKIKEETSLVPAKNFINLACANIEAALRTRKGKVVTAVVAVEFFNDETPLAGLCVTGVSPENVNEGTLTGSAKAVYDFCKKEGLAPGIVWKHSNQENHSICITVQLPVGKVIKKVKFPKKQVTSRKKAKLGTE